MLQPAVLFKAIIITPFPNCEPDASTSSIEDSLTTVQKQFTCPQQWRLRSGETVTGFTDSPTGDIIKLLRKTVPVFIPARYVHARTHFVKESHHFSLWPCLGHVTGRVTLVSLVGHTGVTDLYKAAGDLDVTVGSSIVQRSTSWNTKCNREERFAK